MLLKEYNAFGFGLGFLLFFIAGFFIWVYCKKTHWYLPRYLNPPSGETVVVVIAVVQGAGRHAELPRQPPLEPVDKWSLLHQPSLSVPPLDDIVTKILNDDSTELERPAAAVIGHDAGDSMLHADQWDHGDLSDISAKSQSCTSDVFSFDGYECFTLSFFR